MVDYAVIKNKRLRELILASESIQTLAEEEIRVIVEGIVKLPPEGEQAMIAELEKEQEEIRQAKLNRGITPAKEQKFLAQKMKEVAQVKKDFQKIVLKEKEKSEAQDSQNTATKILQEL